MWLITRPFVWLFKLVGTVLGAPMRIARGHRRRSDHRQLKELRKRQA